jgi:Tol biopolymer transport system component
VSGDLTTLQWVDTTGKKEPLGAKPGDYGDPALSPDGKRVAVMVTEQGSSDIWVYDPQREAMTRLTSAERIIFSQPGVRTANTSFSNPEATASFRLARMEPASRRP